jgi:hypothetical protein
VTDVYLEIGKSRVFACAVGWPGWARAARTEDLALETLDAYEDRYAVIAAAAKVKFKPTEFVVVQRIPGDAGTDFGAPSKPAAADVGPFPPSEVDLLGAAWRVFDSFAAKSVAELRKGPRGGGRDRDKMIDHVLGSEASYARAIGLKPKQPALDDVPAIEAMRASIIAALLDAAGDGQPRTPKGWPPRYVLRRMAWHVIDHLWEMEDRQR